MEYKPVPVEIFSNVCAMQDTQGQAVKVEEDLVGMCRDIKKTKNSLNEFAVKNEILDATTSDNIAETSLMDKVEVKGERPYKCKLCGECFTEGGLTNYHLLTPTGEKPHTRCNICGKCLSKKNNLTKHMGKQTSEKPYTCLECGKCFTDSTSLTMHMMVHSRESPHTCEECGKCFTQKQSLQSHMRTHTGERPYECKVCGKCFASLGTLNYHLLTHTGEKSYPCKICGQFFLMKQTLQRHMRTHTGERPYKCTECEMGFPLAYSLKRHMFTHSGERPHTCEECGKCFKLKTNLQAHIRIHTEERPFSCEECGKCFSHSGNLHKHMKIHIHKKEKNSTEISSQDCVDESEVNPPSMQVETACNVLAVNDKQEIALRVEGPHKCDECGKCFIKKNYLRAHMKTHTGERPYSCTQCGKCFALELYLERHIIRHTGARAFSCEECGKCFAQSYSLKRHMKIHVRGKKKKSTNKYPESFVDKPLSKTASNVDIIDDTHGIVEDVEPKYLLQNCTETNPSGNNVKSLNMNIVKAEVIVDLPSKMEDKPIIQVEGDVRDAIVAEGVAEHTSNINTIKMEDVKPEYSVLEEFNTSF